MKAKLLTGLFLSAVLNTDAFAQTSFDSEKIIFKNLKIEFCYQGEQDDMPSLNRNGNLLLDIFKTISSKGEIEFDMRAKRITFSETQTKVKNFRDIANLVDESVKESSGKTNCTREMEATLFLRQID